MFVTLNHLSPSCSMVSSPFPFTWSPLSSTLAKPGAITWVDQIKRPPLTTDASRATSSLSRAGSASLRGTRTTDKAESSYSPSSPPSSLLSSTSTSSIFSSPSSLLSSAARPSTVNACSACPHCQPYFYFISRSQKILTNISISHSAIL